MSEILVLKAQDNAPEAKRKRTALLAVTAVRNVTSTRYRKYRNAISTRYEYRYHRYQVYTTRSGIRFNSVCWPTVRQNQHFGGGQEGLSGYA